MVLLFTVCDGKVRREKEDGRNHVSVPNTSRSAHYMPSILGFRHWDYSKGQHEISALQWKVRQYVCLNAYILQPGHALMVKKESQGLNVLSYMKHPKKKKQTKSMKQQDMGHQAPKGSDP